VRKYLNYILFGAVVLLVVGLAVSHSRHMRSLLNDMIGDDPQAHASAAAELIKAEQFSDAITGELPAVRVKVARALQDLPTGDSVKQALILLKDQDKDVRAQALTTLEAIGAHSQETIDALAVGLKDGDVNIRKGTIAALTAPANAGGIGPREDVVKAVLAIMKKEADARGPGGDVLGSPRFVAEGANKISVPPLLGYLSDKDDGVKSGAADALGKIGDAQAVPALVGVIHNPEIKPDVRRIATGAVALIADKSCEPLLTEAITDTNTDNEARAQAARGLGKIATPTAIDTLVKALNDDDLKLRSAAVAALARAGQSDSVRVRQSVLNDLLAALRDPNPSLKLGAEQALQGIHAPEANAALTQTLQSSQDTPAVRAAAAAALGFPDNRASVAPLVTALGDKEGTVAAAAQQALQAIGPAAIPDLLATMQQGGPNALYAAQVVGRQGAPALPALEQAAKTAPPMQQRWIAVALGEIGTADVRAPLQELAQSQDANVKYVAQQQLNRLGAQ
jgi:HEAT repeat protein